jgi:hypothetical protein
MYVSPNFKSKKDLKTAVREGKTVTVYSPGPFPCPTEGRVSVEGPHYPEPHRWYGNVLVKDSVVQKVLD